MRDSLKKSCETGKYKKTWLEKHQATPLELSGNTWKRRLLGGVALEDGGTERGGLSHEKIKLLMGGVPKRRFFF